MRILAGTVDAGGNFPPTLEILRELAGRGHAVRVLGHTIQREAVERAGLRFEPWSSARHWDPRPADPGVRTMLSWLRLASDPGYGRDLHAGACAEAVDLVLVDCMIPGALRQAGRIGAPVALVMHAYARYWHDQWSPRTPMGLWLRLSAAHPARLAAAPDLAVLTTLPQLDRFAALPPRMRATELVQTGPVLPGLPVRAAAAGDEAPLLVSLSTIGYPGQQACLQRLLDALGTLPVRAIATLGHALDPGRLRVPGNVEVRDFVPHHEVLPAVRAVITHGGHGTTMLALAHGLPVLVLPMSRHADQSLVAESVVASGAGLTLSKHASVTELRDGIRALLDGAELRRAAQALGDVLRAGDGRARAADCLEEAALAGRGRDARPWGGRRRR